MEKINKIYKEKAKNDNFDFKPKLNPKSEEILV